MEAGSGFHRWLKSLRPADVRISQLRRRAEPTRFLYGIECEHPERWHRRIPTVILTPFTASTGTEARGAVWSRNSGITPAPPSVAHNPWA
jgi:hypothetical protein